MLRCMKEVSRQSAGKIFDANDEVDVDVEGEADALLKNGETIQVQISYPLKIIW